MSRASRSKKKEARLKERQKKKAARHTLYKGYAEQGKTKRSARYKRKVLAEKKKLSPRKIHRNPCGNVACQKCYTIFHTMLEKKRHARHSGTRVPA